MKRVILLTFIACSLLILTPKESAHAVELYITPTSTTWTLATISVIDIAPQPSGCWGGGYGANNFNVDQFLLANVGGIIIESSTIQPWPYNLTSTFSGLGFTPPATGGYYQLIAEEGLWAPCGTWYDLFGGSAWFYISGGNFITTVSGPSAPFISNLNQYQSDGATVIAEGGTTSENTVAFGATLQSSSTGQLQLRVEVKPADATLTGTANLTSALVAPGSFVAVSTPRLPDGQYHWQARVWDSEDNLYSPWQTFGPSASATDFAVHTGLVFTQEPIVEDTTATFICGNASVGGAWNIPCGTVSETASSSFVLGDITIGGDSDSSYNNHAVPPAIYLVVTDSNGELIAAATNPCSLGYNACGGYHFTFNPVVVPAQFQISMVASFLQGYTRETYQGLTVNALQPFIPIAIASWTLQQYKSDAATMIDEGQTTTENTVVFGAVLRSSSTSQLRLEIEVTSSLSLTTTTTSIFVDPGTFATASLQALPDATYHWRARVRDASGTVSDWQTASSSDFVVHQVPLFTQVQSDFPDSTLTDLWSRAQYGSGNYSDCLKHDNAGHPIPNSSTVGRCGCAVASMVMLGRYYGITTGVDGSSSDPGTMNTWLIGNDGYKSYNAIVGGLVDDGNLNWGKAVEYLGVTQSGVKKTYLSLDYFNASTTTQISTIDSYVNSLKPAIAYSSLFGHYFIINSKLANNNYAVRDPKWFSTKTLNETDNIAQNVRGYNKTFDTANLFSFLSTPQRISAAIYFYLASPAEYLVTDPQGRRLGIDPTTNTTYNEIPNGSYTLEGPIADSDTVLDPSTLHMVKTIYIPAPIDGNYDVKVIGTESGSYTANSFIYDNNGNSQSNVVVASTTPNQTTDYNLSFSSSSASTTLTLAALSTTTANIWIGLKNSDDVGIKFDLEADILKNGTSIASGTLDSVAGGSSGFNNAHLYSIPVSVSTPTTFTTGDTLSVRILVRNACSGSGHNSGTARLWYGDSGANSNSSPIVTNAFSYFLDGANNLLTATGTTRQSANVAAGAKCSAYKSFGTWNFVF